MFASDSGLLIRTRLTVWKHRPSRLHNWIPSSPGWQLRSRRWNKWGWEYDRKGKPSHVYNGLSSEIRGCPIPQDWSSMALDAEQLPGTPGSILEYLVMKSSDLWRNVHFVRIRTESNFIGLKFVNQIKTLPSANSGSICVFQKFLSKGRWFLGKTTAEDLITWDHQDSWLLRRDTFSPCSPNVYQMSARVCKICACLAILLLYLYLPVERYSKTWGPGEPAHLKELYQEGAHVMRSNILKTELPPLLTSVFGSERTTMSELKGVSYGDLGRYYTNKHVYPIEWHITHPESQSS